MALNTQIHLLEYIEIILLEPEALKVIISIEFWSQSYNEIMCLTQNLNLQFYQIGLYTCLNNIRIIT